MTPPVIRPDVAAWLRQLATPKDDAVIDAMHELAEQRSFPIVGPEVGRLLAQIVDLVGARSVFEMGSGFGYSTLWFARAVGKDGRVSHTDSDPTNTELARGFLERAGVLDRVSFGTGDALELLSQAPRPTFDILFCDVDKEQYPEAYDVMVERVRVGGAVIIDNLMWCGRVAAGLSDAATEGVRRYIDKMWSDSRFLSSLLPIRDGVGLSIRVS